MIIKPICTFFPTIFFFLIESPYAGIASLIGSGIQKYFLYNEDVFIADKLYTNEYDYKEYSKKQRISLIWQIVKDESNGYSLLLFTETLFVACSYFLNTPLLLPSIGLFIGAVISKLGDYFDNIMDEFWITHSRHYHKF